MEKVGIGSSNFTEVMVLDKPGAGNACHEYLVRLSGGDNAGQQGFNETEVFFQKGPIKENGVNGCHQEDLLAIVLHRLQSFQAGEYSCRENALAITKLEEAMHWLNHRTKARQDRGVEGRSVV